MLLTPTIISQLFSALHSRDHKPLHTKFATATPSFPPQDSTKYFASYF